MMRILKNYFDFSVKRIFTAGICFIVLFFLITNLFNLPFEEKTGLKTKENKITGEITGPVSDNNIVIQSLFFHKPIRLHSMDILISDYNNTISMKEIQYHIKDKLGQYIYSSAIPVDSVADGSWLHLEMGDVILKPNQKYFVHFQGTVENETVVCPAFYLMENDEISDVLYIRGEVNAGTSLPGKALCATYKYDIVPMGKGVVLFFSLLLVFIIGIVCLKPEIARKNLCRIPMGIWIIFWGGLFVNVLFNNNPVNKAYFNQIVATGWFLAIFIIIVLVSLTYKKFKKDEQESDIYSFLYNHRAITGIAFFVVLFAIQLIIITNIYQKIGWDVGASWNNAVLWHTDENVVSDWALLTYPNNVGITYFMYFLQLLASGLQAPGQYFFVVIVNTMIVNFGIYMTYKIAYKLKGYTVAIISVALVTVLIGISGWIIVPYTDTVTLWIPVTIMYLYILLKENSLYGIKSTLAASGIGLLSVMGYYLKPQCIIVLIAIVLKELYEYIIFIKNSNIKNKIKKYNKNKSILKDKFIPLLIGGGFMFFLNFALGSFILPDDFTKNNSMPATHFVMMGLCERPYGGLGAYCADDVFKTCDYETKKEKNKYCQSVILKRLKDFGIAGFINHLYYKGIWVLGDGTFFWQKEGGFFLEDYSLNDSSFQKVIREYYYDNGTGNNKKHIDFMGVITGIWFLTLCFIVFAPLGAVKMLGNNGIAICLSVLGCVMFTLLFEGRSRYIINYLPFFAFIAAAGIYDFSKFISKKHNKEEKINNAK